MWNASGMKKVKRDSTKVSGSRSLPAILWRPALPPALNHCHLSFLARRSSNATPWSDVKTLFSTAKVGSREPLCPLARRRLQDDCRSRHTAREQMGFRAVLGYSDLAGMGMMVLENSPMTVNRTRRDSARTPTTACSYAGSCRGTGAWSSRVVR